MPKGRSRSRLSWCWRGWPAFLPATTAWSGDPEVADISEALTQAVTALRSVPADDALGLTRAIGVARVRASSRR